MPACSHFGVIALEASGGSSALLVPTPSSPPIRYAHFGLEMEHNILCFKLPRALWPRGRKAFCSLPGSEDAHCFLASPPPHPLFCSGCCTAPLASGGRCVIAGAVVPIPPGPPDTQPCHRELCSLQGSSAHRAGYGLLTFPDVFGGERVCPLFLCPFSRSFYSWFLRF